MERKRLTLLASSDINYDQRLQKIAAALDQDEWQVLLLGVNRKHSVGLQQRPFQQQRVSCVFSKGIWFYLDFNWRFFLLLMRNTPEVIVANDPDTLPAVWILSWFRNFDLVYDAHEYFSEVPELAGKPFKRKIWESLERWGTGNAKFCYTVNESLAQILGEKYQKSFGVVRNVPLAISLKQAGEKKNYVLYQGALNEGRGLETLIEAMAEVPLELWIAGKGDLEDELKELVQKKGLSERVKFLGMLLPEELQTVTFEAKIGINILAATSLNYYYSLANKCFDYMHAGVPAIHMHFPEYVRLQEQGPIGVLINDLKVAELCEAILKLYTDKTYYDTCVVGALKLADEYQWDKEKIKLQSLYHALKTN